MLAGFSGTQGRPAEFCQEKYGAVFLARDIGVKGEKGQTTEREKEGWMCVCVREVFLDRVDKRFPGAFLSQKTLWGNASHIKHTLPVRMVNKRILCAIPLCV